MKIDKPTLAAVNNLVKAIIAALENLGAPERVKAALLESGDVEHVIWWIKNECDSFDKWFDEVKTIAKLMGWPDKNIETIDKEAWHDTHYKEGRSPASAWRDEFKDAAR